ncbi:UDP-4-amino-4,6-dideoxy-N-acetyl-beta-L-altrosamine N-acetyltransferase [Nonomuraea sp. CA-143628]|uniref:UDP-4-amino-4, 6-dideoxy-N-acetyl-beta-L-altrosamine N-acetyltransferase n=1 Tax=Nonomuraea sp. CA-143628 TaxID=3239997 RepID=UPI003D8DFA72
MLRPVHDHELPVIRRWRNHPRVRAASFTTHVIAEDEHARWWAGVKDDPARRVLIYVHDGTAAGVVTFSELDPATRSGEWGFYLDLAGLEPSGALLPAWIGLERAAIDHAFGPLGLTTLRGEVLAGNEAARGLHRRFGFAEVDVHRRDIDGVRRDVVTVQLMRKDDHT